MKNLFIGLLLITSAASAQVTSGLIAHYSLNGNTNDLSANGNNGTNYGSTLANGRFGQPNTAYYFDGNDYIFIPNSTSLNPTNAITISAWYKSVSFSGNGYSSIVDKGYTSHVAPTYQYKLGVTGDLYGGSAYGRFGFSITTSNNV